MNDVLLICLKIAAVLSLVALNGFFVAAEFAIVKIRSTQLQTLADKGNRRAYLGQKLIKHMDAYLSACQLGITMASLGLGWIGEPFVSKLLEGPLQDMGVTNATAIHTLSFAFGFSVITFLHIVLGEQAPKILAIRKPEASTLVVAMPLIAFYKLMYPAIWGLNHAANWILSLAGISPMNEQELVHSEEELRMVLAQGQMSDLGRSVSLRALDLHKRTARQIMLPRTQIVYLATRRDLTQNLEIARQSKHTRFPLCEDSLDNILGLIHMKDLAWLIREKSDHANLLDIKRDVLFVPETTTLEKLLNTFRARHTHLAILVDEFGGTVGMITLEDIVEEIVGEIQDEFDQESSRWTQVGENEYRVDGALPLHDLLQAVGARFEADDISTLGGFVINKVGYFPKQGERVDLGEWECTVLKTDGRRIQQVLLKRKIESVRREA
ncbi:MAG: HlyC/CorC family transporter [Verrucomicrobiae bacterium]|nr:HlyC/CorC family transporter [Verrucomicrobiae bacterium]